MLRITIATLSLLITFGPAIAGDHGGHSPAVEPNTVTEELQDDAFTKPSQAISEAAHNAATSQQGGYVTGNAATTMGVSTLSSSP